MNRRRSLLCMVTVYLIFNSYFIHTMSNDRQGSFEVVDTVVKKYSGSIRSLRCLIKNLDDNRQVTVDLDEELKEHSNEIIDQLIVPSKIPGISLLLANLLIGTYLTVQGNNGFLDCVGLGCNIAGLKKLIDCGHDYQNKKGYKFHNLINESFIINPKQSKPVEIFFDVEDVSTIRLLINDKAIDLDPAQFFLE